MYNESKLLIGTLAQAVAKKPLQMPDTVDWQLFRYSSHIHGVEPLVYQGL